MVKKAVLAAIGGGIAAVVGAVLLLPKASSYVGPPPPVPTGSTFLGVASLSGNDTLVVPFNINGTVVDVAGGVGGGYDLAFDGVHPYLIAVPVALGASTFQYFAIISPTGVIDQITDPTFYVPAGNYGALSTQINAYYS